MEGGPWYSWLKKLINVYSVIPICRAVCSPIHPPVYLSTYLSPTFVVYCCLVTKSYLTLWDPMDYSLSSSSVHGISQARILEWAAVSFSRGSSWPRSWTHVSSNDRWILYCWVSPTYLPTYPSVVRVCLTQVKEHRLWNQNVWVWLLALQLPAERTWIIHLNFLCLRILI